MEDRRDLHREEDGDGDNRERDQGVTHHELHELIGLLLFGLRFVHMPINDYYSGRGSPSHGGSSTQR